jgi:vanillate O-demethylase monooxygenase subunit
MYLKNCWYQAGWSEEIADGRTLVRTLLDEPILFWRDRDGAPRALLDMCPHRFAPLSAGIVADDIVVCGYHGLAFGKDGRCVRNPHGPVTSAMKVKSFPVIERHLAIWIWLGDPDKADPGLLPDLSFIDDCPPSARILGTMPTSCDYRLLSDNILDLSHADYLHPSSLGGVMTKAKATMRDEGDRVVARWDAQDADPIPAARASIPAGAKADFWIQVDWQAPALMVLATATTQAGTPSTPANEARTLHNMVPETATSTHYFFCSVRGFLRDDPGFSVYIREALLNAFQNEDKPMIEAQQRRIGHRDFWDMKPILLKTDGPAVLARRKLAAMIEREQAH